MSENSGSSSMMMMMMMMMIMSVCMFSVAGSGLTLYLNPDILKTLGFTNAASGTSGSGGSSNKTCTAGQGNDVVFYGDKNYGGDHIWRSKCGEYGTFDYPGKLSSIKVPKELKAILYSKSQLEGDVASVTGNVINLHDKSWGDKTFSYKIIGRDEKSPTGAKYIKGEFDPTPTGAAAASIT